MLRALDDGDVGCFHGRYLGEELVGCCLFGYKFDVGLLNHMDFEILNWYNGACLKGVSWMYQSEIYMNVLNKRLVNQEKSIK